MGKYLDQTLSYLEQVLDTLNEAEYEVLAGGAGRLEEAKQYILFARGIVQEVKSSRYNWKK